METLELKKKFARELLRSNDPMKAAQVVLSSMGQVLIAAAQWPNDENVKKEIERIKREEGLKDFLPTKEDFAFLLWDRMKKCRDDGDFSKIATVYANTMGYVEKGQTNINNNILSNSNKVMIVKDHGNDKTWSSNLIEQQRSLVNDAER
jgi:hypothetical protein